MHLTDRTILITGGNRGIGRALVDEALARDARRVWVGTRADWHHPDPRVTRLALDVTDPAQVEAAAAAVDRLDVLVNNAGIALFDDLSDPWVLRRHLDVNLFGVQSMVLAFRPHLARSRGAIINNLSLNALAPLPVVGSYGASKAAAFSLTQSLRALLAADGITVHGVLTGPVDTDMNRDFDIPKETTAACATAILDGLAAGDDEIFPDPVSREIADAWRTGAIKALERELAAVSAEVAAGVAS